MRVFSLGSREPGAPSACLLDPSSEQWIALAPAVQWRARRGALRNLMPPPLSASDAALLAASQSLVALLGADAAVRAAAVELASQAAAENWDGCVVDASRADPMPFTPLSFRDAALFSRHLKQSAAGFTPLILAQGHLLQALGMLLTKPLRLPDGLNPLSRPAYYQGNPLTFIGDGQTVAWPTHCSAGDYTPSDALAGAAAPRARGRAGSLDYELEVAVLITRPVSRRAEPAEVAAAIGGFVLINDWSARDTQADELLSVGFGFVKSKGFATSIASEVVSADALWQPGGGGRLFGGDGLRCDVLVNGEPRRGASGRPGSTAENRVCSLEALVAFCALDEGLRPGELIGLGTVPDCCGLELKQLLRPGDEVTLRVEALGSLINRVGAPHASSSFKFIDTSAGAARPPGRLRTALRLALTALVAPPLLFVALLLGAAAALVWPQLPHEAEPQRERAQQVTKAERGAGAGVGVGAAAPTSGSARELM